MFRFEEPFYLYLLLLLPVLTVLYIYSNYKRRKAIREFGDPELMAPLMPDVSKRRPDIKFALILVCIALFAVLLARPQFGSRLETVKRQGVEVLIVFAGDAFVQLPITSDYISAKMFLESITPELITRQGTDLGAALTLANRSFTTQPEVGRTIILITDGENHEGGVEQAIKELTDKNIQINVLGIGSPEGSPIPITDSRDFRRDKEGNIVVTKLNEAMCQELAKAGNGVYVRVDNTNTAQRAIQQAIDKLAKADIETQVYSDYNEQFQAVAWLLLLFLLVELLIMERQNPLFNNIHLFEK